MSVRVSLACCLVAVAAGLHAQTAAPAQGKPAQATPVRPAPAAQMEFTDDPHLTVAGITDWTAVGGHGADTTLRTSEELARLNARHTPADAAELQARAGLAHSAGNEAEFHRLLGERAELLGDPLLAVHEDAQAAALSPTETNLLQWGSELMLHRAVLEAAEVFAGGVRRYPTSVRLRTALGSALFAEGKYRESQEELCRAATPRQPGQEAYRTLAAVVLGSPEVLGCAVEKAGQWRTEFPGSAEAYCASGLMEARLPGREAVATGLLRHAVTLDPGEAQAWLQLGTMAATLHEDAEAEQDFRAAIGASPRAAEAHFRLAVLLRRSGRAAEAEREFTLHRQLQAEDAARVERERQSVKEFVIAGKQ